MYILFCCTTCTNASAGRQTNEFSTRNTHIQILERMIRPTISPSPRLQPHHSCRIDLQSTFAFLRASPLLESIHAVSYRDCQNVVLEV